MKYKIPEFTDEIFNSHEEAYDFLYDYEEEHNERSNYGEPRLCPTIESYVRYMCEFIEPVPDISEITRELMRDLYENK